jgi:hypothetical protein
MLKVRADIEDAGQRGVEGKREERSQRLCSLQARVLLVCRVSSVHRVTLTRHVNAFCYREPSSLLLTDASRSPSSGSEQASRDRMGW